MKILGEQVEKSWLIMFGQYCFRSKTKWDLREMKINLLLWLLIFTKTRLQPQKTLTDPQSIAGLK